MRNTPIIQVLVKPSALKDTLINMSDKVTGLKFEDCSDKADRLTLTVDNYDLQEFDNPIWRAGNTMYVTWGYPEVMAVERKCTIRKIKGFRTLTVESLGMELELAVEQKVRHYENYSYSDIAYEVAYEWGYRGQKELHIQDSKVLKSIVGQSSQTDQQLMTRMARELGWVWYIDHDGFHFHEHKVDTEPCKVLTYFTDTSPVEILDISIEQDVTRRAGSVTAKGYNPITRQGIDFDATTFTADQKKSLSARLEAPGMGEWNVPGLEKIGHHDSKPVPHATVEEVQIEAQAALRLAQQGAVKLKMTIAGDPTLFAKSVIQINGIGKRLSGLYYVKEVEHTIGAGYTCSVECFADGSNGHNVEIITPDGVSAIQRLPAKQFFQKRDSNGIDVVDPKTLKPILPAELRAMRGIPEATEQKDAVAKTPDGAQKNKGAKSAAAKTAPTPGPTASVTPAQTTASSTNPQQLAVGDTPALSTQNILAKAAESSTDEKSRAVLSSALGSLNTASGQKSLEDKGSSGIASKASLEAAYLQADDQGKIPAASSDELQLPNANQPDATYRGDYYKDAAVPGNLDLENRPWVPVKDEEGNPGYATVYSMGFYDDSVGYEVVVPTVSHDGRLMSADEAREYYYATGEHMGMYRTVDDAEKAAIMIHEDQQRSMPNNTLAVRPNTKLSDAELENLMLQDPVRP